MIASDASNKIDLLALQPHFLDHAIPVWQALPEEARGVIYTQEALFAHAIALGAGEFELPSGGFELQPYENLLTSDSERPIFVMSNGDIVYLRTAKHPRKRVIWMEHGTGQSWTVMPFSWRFPDMVVLWLLPGEGAAKIARHHMPQANIRKVGCPKMDPWHKRWEEGMFDEGDPECVAISWHWPNMKYPQTLDALGHFRSALPALKRAFRRMIGHAHPLCGPQMKVIYDELGIEYVADFAEVMERASVYGSDCSSTIYEFAATHRPVVVMNAPWYPRDIEIGIRFWEAAHVGTHCNEPADLVAAFRRAPNYHYSERNAALSLVYEFMDEHCSQRAADAIMEVIT